MSLARQFGFEVQPAVPTNTDGSSFTSLAVRLKERAQAQAAASAAAALPSTNPVDMDHSVSQAPDGSLQFTIHVDTTSAMKVCKSALLCKGFRYAQMSETKLLVVPKDNLNELAFELSVESLDFSACTAEIKFQVPPSYSARDAKDAVAWSTRLKELYYSIVFRFN